MGKFDEKQRAAQSLYVRGSLNRKEIASLVEVNEKTLRAWIDKGNWDAMKEAISVTRQQLLHDAYVQLRAVNIAIADRGGIPNKELSDAKSMIRKEIELFSDSPLHLYVEVFDEVSEWLMKGHPAEAVLVSTLFLKFLEQKQKENENA